MYRNIVWENSDQEDIYIRAKEKEDYFRNDFIDNSDFSELNSEEEEVLSYVQNLGRKQSSQYAMNQVKTAKLAINQAKKNSSIFERQSVEQKKVGRPKKVIQKPDIKKMSKQDQQQFKLEKKQESNKKNWELHSEKYNQSRREKNQLQKDAISNIYQKLKNLKIDVPKPQNVQNPLILSQQQKICKKSDYSILNLNKVQCEYDTIDEFEYRAWLKHVQFTKQMKDLQYEVIGMMEEAGLGQN